MQRVGVYAGTFESTHEGHIAFAAAAQQQCHLEKVLFLPERHPRYKKHVSSFEKRVKRLRQETAGWPDFEVLTLPESRFTIRDTLPELKRQSREKQIVLLVGSDVMRSVMYWEDIKEALNTVHFAVGLRRHDTKTEVQRIIVDLERSAKVAVEYTIIETDYKFSASTLIHRLGSTARRSAVDFSP